MKIPKFKPTKWKLYFCSDCRVMRHTKTAYCVDQTHNIQEVENVPFFIPDIEIDYVSKWTGLKSELTKRHFTILPSRFEKVIMGCGIKPGGKIPNQWWMYSKCGTSLSLMWIK